MKKEEIYDQLKEIIKVYLPEDVSVGHIKPTSDFIKELNINSSNLVDIVLDVEDAFDIEINDEAIERMTNVEGAISLIAEKIENN